MSAHTRPSAPAFALVAMRGAIGAACVLSLGACLQRIDSERTPPEPQPATFALVAYSAGPGGALEVETLDSGLSPEDCAWALGAAYRMGGALPSELLVSCELETAR